MRERETGFHEISFTFQPSLYYCSHLNLSLQVFLLFFFFVWFAVGSGSEMPQQPPPPGQGFPSPCCPFTTFAEGLGPTQAEHGPQTQ